MRAVAAEGVTRFPEAMEEGVNPIVREFLHHALPWGHRIDSETLHYSIFCD